MLPAGDSKKGLLQQAAEVAINAGIQYGDFERIMIRTYFKQALIEHKGNQCKAAKASGVHRNTMSRWINALEIDVHEIVNASRPPRMHVMSQRFKRFKRA